MVKKNKFFLVLDLVGHSSFSVVDYKVVATSMDGCFSESESGYGSGSQDSLVCGPSKNGTKSDPPPRTRTRSWSPSPTRYDIFESRKSVTPPAVLSPRLEDWNLIYPGLLPEQGSSGTNTIKPNTIIPVSLEGGGPPNQAILNGVL